MTEEADVKKPLIEEFKDLTLKQWGSIIIAFAVCLVLVATGLFLSMCMGFFLVAVLLYMVPHIAGVSSPKVKGTIGALFLVIILILAAVAYGGSATDKETHNAANVYLNEVTYDETGHIEIYTDTTGLEFTVEFAPITAMAYGHPLEYDVDHFQSVPVTAGTGKYTADAPLEDGKYYYILITAFLDDDKREYSQIFVNTGMSGGDVCMLNLVGSSISILEIALIFFVMLIFSELMRRSARKKRDQMIKDGRLYPKGYDKCKNCGTMILPGEITCRKCGAAIEVPEDVKVLHKKDFFQCSDCGTEVPMDAKFCPKCGAVFDEGEETEIKHADGSVDVSTESFECSECGKKVPANAQRCPYCGAVFDEDEQEEKKE